MKKILCLLLLLSLLLPTLSGCGETVDYREHLSDYVKTMAFHGGFHILQLTDIHWNSGTQIGDETYGGEGYLEKVITEAIAHAGSIDLIEITGDTFMLTDKRAVRKFIDFMEDIGIPYAILWGNHDREGTYNPNWLSEQFLNAPYSLYTEVDNDNVHERSNYVIELENPDGSVAWQLFQLDSGASYRDGAADIALTYDYLRDDQFEWLTAEHARAEDASVICFYHIPQADNRAAYEVITSGEKTLKNKFAKLENFGDSRYAPLTSDIFAQNNVKAAIMGHAHNNDWTFTDENGIVYSFGVKTGKELYYASDVENGNDYGIPTDETFDLIGASLITLLDTDGNFTLEHLYLNEREDGDDFVLWVNYDD